MKKSILLFILWAAFGFVLTCIYMAVMMPPASDTYITGWILFLITAIISPLMMFLIRKQAKSEKNHLACGSIKNTADFLQRRRRSRITDLHSHPTACVTNTS